MVVYLRLLSESFGFAMNALRNNKLRSKVNMIISVVTREITNKIIGTYPILIFDR